MKKGMSTVVFIILSLLVSVLSVQSQEKKIKPKRKTEIYFSWGYNKEWYTNSTVKVMQMQLGNDYKIKNISAHDHIGWDQGIFSIPLSIPQYNYRIGFYNNKKNIGFEINFDHTKYIISDQNAHIVGTLNYRQVDTTVRFNDTNGFHYYLNNGANFLLFNVVKKWHLKETKDEKIKLDLLGKAGIGPVIPHVENLLFGRENNPHFQIGGWNVGAEAALRATFYKSVFLEFCNKLDYASYSGLRLNPGTARQMFGTYELILNLGFVIPSGKHIN
jgi:hypothetical protein